MLKCKFSVHFTVNGMTSLWRHTWKSIKRDVLDILLSLIFGSYLLIWSCLWIASWLRRLLTHEHCAAGLRFPEPHPASSFLPMEYLLWTAAETLLDSVASLVVANGSISCEGPCHRCLRHRIPMYRTAVSRTVSFCAISYQDWRVVWYCLLLQSLFCK